MIRYLIECAFKPPDTEWGALFLFSYAILTHVGCGKNSKYLRDYLTLMTRSNPITAGYSTERGALFLISRGCGKTINQFFLTTPIPPPLELK